MNPSRSAWASLTDSALLSQCQIDTYRASGPGGQKRNKTSSAVRLRHLPSGILVIAEESRSQHENKSRALKRLRRALYLQLREPVSDTTGAAIRRCQDPAHRLVAHVRSVEYLPAIALIMDLLEDGGGRVAPVAQQLETSTANLIDFLRADDGAWRAVNELRKRHGCPPLQG